LDLLGNRRVQRTVGLTSLTLKSNGQANGSLQIIPKRRRKRDIDSAAANRVRPSAKLADTEQAMRVTPQRRGKQR
jgi:hypothetical protein